MTDKKEPRMKIASVRYNEPYTTYLWVDFMKKHNKRDYIIRLDEKVIASPREEGHAPIIERTSATKTAGAV